MFLLCHCACVLPVAYNGNPGYTTPGNFVRHLTSTPALVDASERTTVTVEAVAFDERTAGSGCSPDGCTPENTRDSSLDANSRWSCKGDLVKGDGGCCIEYFFDEPQDIVDVNIAFHKGAERTRTLNVYNNGDFFTQIVSSGSTNGYEEFGLDSDETADLTLCLDDSMSDSDWLSITEVGARSGKIYVNTLYMFACVDVMALHSTISSN